MIHRHHTAVLLYQLLYNILTHVGPRTSPTRHRNRPAGCAGDGCRCFGPEGPRTAHTLTRTSIYIQPYLVSASTSREVNEARGGLILAAGRVHSKKKKIEQKKNTKKSATPKTRHETHISPATATTSRRRVQNTSHALAHTRPLP